MGPTPHVRNLKMNLGGHSISLFASLPRVATLNKPLLSAFQYCLLNWHFEDEQLNLVCCGCRPQVLTLTTTVTRGSAQMAIYTSQCYLPGRAGSLVNSKSVFGPALVDLQMAPAVLSHLVISILILIHTGPLMQ